MSVTPMTRARRLSFREVVREAADVTELRHTRYGLMPLGVLVLVEFVQAFDNQIFGVLRPEIRQGLGISVTAVIAVSSVVGVITVLAGPLIGFLADRTRRTRLVGVSAIVSGLFSMLTGAGNSLSHLIAARTGDEVSEYLGAIPGNALAADYYPVESRGRVYAFLRIALDTARLLAPVTVGALAVAFGWRTPFVITGPLLIGAGVLVLVRLREPVRGYWERKHLGAAEDDAAREEHPVGFAEAIRILMATRTLRRVLVAAAVSGVASQWFTGIFSFFLAERFGLNPLERGAIAVPGQVIGIAALFVGGGLVDVLVRRRPGRVLAVLGIISVVAAGALAVMVAVPSIPLLVVMGAVFAATTGLINPASATIFSVIIPPRLRGQGFGILAYAQLPGLVLAPIAGAIASAYSLEAALFAAIPLFVVASLVQISAAAFFESDMRAAIAASMASREFERAKAAGQTKLLVCRDVDVSYGSVQVLFNVDLDVEEGEIVSLLGTNGAGKSTLLRAIAGLQEAGNGAVVFDGRDITHLPPYEIARLGVVLMPGGKGVFPGLTVAANLDLALWSCPEDERQARLASVFEFFPELTSRMGDEAALLSGGEQQMVALGQALLSKPRLLMIDELSLGLAPAVVSRLLDIVRAMAAQGTTVILVEQSVNVALTVAHRAVFMEKGQVRFEGPTADLLARPDLMRAVYVRGAGALSDGRVRAAGAATAGQARAILELDGLVKHYGGKTAVDGVSLVLREGEALGLIGPNGAGKTTLFDLVSGLQSPDGGRVVLDGVDVTGMSPDARARVGLLRRFQDARLFPALTVFETLCVALERKLDVRNTFLLATQAPAVRKSEARARRGAERLIELFELGGARDKFVSDLSTGLRRVVDLACVLAAEPRVLLLDEPSSGIAQAEAESLGPLLRRVRWETGCSMLVIEHDMPLISAVSDELVGLVAGRVVAQGPAADVLSHPEIVDAYLGDRQEAIQRQGART